MPRGIKPILWFEYPVFNQHDKNSQLKPDELETWLRFLSEYICHHCPTDVKIVFQIGLELAETKFPRLVKKLQIFRNQHWCKRPEFRLYPLPPLSHVPEAELLDFLEDSHQSSCPANIQSEMAERLFAKTEGRFDELVELLEEAGRNHSWNQLLSDLRKEQGDNIDEDNEPF